MFKSYSVALVSNLQTIPTDFNKSYRSNKPIGISLGSGGNTGDQQLIFTGVLEPSDKFDYKNFRMMSRRYPYARRFYNENLMKAEKNFGTYEQDDTFSFTETNPKEETYTIKKNKGFNIIDNGLDSIGDDVLPSIQGKTLKIPLYFYFQRNIKKALPLIALSNTNPGVEIEITLRPIKDLYLSRFSPIVDANKNFWESFPQELISSLGYYVKNNDNNNYKTSGIQFFLGNNSTSTTTSISGSELLKELDSFSVNTKLEYNVIYLDKDERKRIKEGKHQYFIESITRFQKTNNNSQETEIEFKFRVNKPLKEFIFIPKRNDAKELNQWDNFTNYVIPNLSTSSTTYINFGGNQWSHGGQLNYSSLCKIFNSTSKSFPYPYVLYTKDEISSKLYEKNIIKEITIQSTNDSFKKRKTLIKPGTYYNRQQTSEYYKKKPKDGVYIYSFSLLPKNETPTGEKMKDFENTNEDFNINIKLSDKPDKDNYDLGYQGGDAWSEKNIVDDYFHEINIYSVEYNILEINNGEASLLFS